jgi:phthalate 4,5-dioxygenase oxygenase subunit
VAGIVWVFLGEPGSEPPFPHYRFMDVDDDHRIVAPTVINANYAQVNEGSIDSSHLNYLHADTMKAGVAPLGSTPGGGRRSLDGVKMDATPRLQVENTEFGFHYAAIRGREGDHPDHVRVTAFIAPFGGYVAPDGPAFFAVPMTDERTLLLTVYYSFDTPIGDEPYRSSYLEFFGVDEETRHRLGMSRATCDSPDAASRRNHFFQDRAAMADGRSFTGIHDFTPEDAAVFISMGGVYDREAVGEHIVPADAAIVKMRRLLLHCADVVEKGGDPVGVGLDITGVRANAGDVEQGEDWHQLVPGNRVVDSW